ncbi:MAG: biopolymer transporter ExbD [Kiritimatiellae bacterium]|nr:biopolymer transporter ExbD [Kiritimatiellia bacterium]
MNFRAKLRPEPVGFQLAPMIDVVFLLLCFFMTSQLFAQWEQEIGITLPTASTAETPRRLPGEVILNITREGQVVINAQVLTEARLASQLSRLSNLFPGQPIVIRADRQTPYDHVIRVLDLCRKSGIWNISFATAVPEVGESAPASGEAVRP